MSKQQKPAAKQQPPAPAKPLNKKQQQHSDDDEDDNSDWEDNNKGKATNGTAAKGKQAKAVAAASGKKAVAVSRRKQESEEEDEDDSEEEDEELPAKKVAAPAESAQPKKAAAAAAPAKKAAAASVKRRQESSEEEESEEEDEEEEDEEEDESEEEEEDDRPVKKVAPPAPAKKAAAAAQPKKAAPAKKQVESEEEEDEESEEEDESEDEDEEDESDDEPARKAVPVKGKAAKPAAGKAAQAAPVKAKSAFAALEDDDEEEDESEEEGSEEAESEEEESEEETKPTKPQPAGKKAAAAAAPKPAKAAKGKQAKSKQPKPADDDIDELLAAIEQPKKGGKQQPAVPAATTSSEKNEEAGETAAGEEKDESKMSKAALKRLKQKQKAEAEKARGEQPAAPAAVEAKKVEVKAEEKKEEKKEEKPKAPGGGAGKKENKAVLALKEKLRQQKEDEERRIREEEERRRAEEEEARRLEEEEKRAAEEKERRKRERAEKKEQLRKEGKLLTKTEKEKQRKAQLFLEQLKAQGLPVPDVEHREKPEEKAKRVKYGARVRKEKGGKGKEGGVEMKEAEAGEEEKQQEHVTSVEEVTGAVADLALSPSAAEATQEAAVSKQSEKEGRSSKAGKAAAGKKGFNKAQQAQLEAQRIREAAKAAEEQRRKEKEEQAEKEAEEQAAKQQAEDDEEASRIQQVEDHAAATAELEADAAEPEAEEEEEDDGLSWDMDEEEKEALRKKKEAAKKERLREHQQRQRAEKERKLAELAAAKKRREEEEAAGGNKKALSPTAAGDRTEKTDKASKKTAGSPTSTSPSNKLTEEEESKKAGKKDLRSPICCILGHVDTGKTKLLDKIRSTNVQEHEAGGITQQIGATYFPADVIRAKTAEISKTLKKELVINVPGLLVIDTPGHESFNNLRSRGSGLCDIAILVVDIMHGLEPQTIESINLLKMRKTPFVVALNKIDRCYSWLPTPNAPFRQTLANQPRGTQDEFDKRAREALMALTEQGMNVALWYENNDFRKYVSVIPTSAITGEGIPDLLMLLIQLTQTMMNERLSFLAELQCTVLEVKMVEGHGTTIDVVLVNGVLNEGETIVVCGLQGPIVTTIRALLTPPHMTELRVKSEYVHNKSVKAAMGVKISAQGLEHAIAGSQLLVFRPNRDPTIEELKDEVQADLASVLSKVDKSGQGVCVQASTLGSLEALLSFLSDMKIPVSGISIGPVYRKDVMRASIMLEKRPEYAVILAFDVRVAPEAEKLAAELGVTIFTADIIYHLYDKVTSYMNKIKEDRRTATADIAVFPVVLDVLPNCVFMNKNPLLLGCRIVEGQAKVGTPLCVPAKEKLYIGRISGLQKNHEDVKEARKGDEVAVKIEMEKGGQNIIVGRHFDQTHQLISKLSRESIDQLKANFKEDLTDEDWRLVIKLKKVLDIM